MVTILLPGGIPIDFAYEKLGKKDTNGNHGDLQWEVL